MKAVGVKNLKAQLSEYLRLVKSGETILITERENVIAQIIPSLRQDTFPNNTDDMFDLLAEKGAMTLRSEVLSIKGEDLVSEPPKFSLPVSSRKILDELRKE